MISAETPIYGWWGINKAIFLWMNGTHGPWWDTVMLAATNAGSASTFPYWIAAALLIALFRPTSLPQRNVVVFAVGFAVTGLLVPWLKMVVGLPRPLEALGREFVTIVGPVAHSASFPSGHATFVFLIAAALSPGAPRAAKWGLWIFAVIVGLSRIVVGAHFPADVAGGAMLGLAVAFVLRIVILPGNVHRVAVDQSPERRHP